MNELIARLKQTQELKLLTRAQKHLTKVIRPHGWLVGLCRQNLRGNCNEKLSHTHRLENLEESFEKKDEVRPWGMAEVSCVWRGEAPYADTDPVWFLGLFWPLWNVERLGTFLGKGCWTRFPTAGETGGPRVTTLLQTHKQWHSELELAHGSHLHAVCGKRNLSNENTCKDTTTTTTLSTSDRHNNLFIWR